MSQAAEILRENTLSTLNAVLFRIDPSKLGDVDPEQLGIAIRAEGTRNSRSIVTDYARPRFGTVATFDYTVVIEHCKEIAIIYSIAGTSVFGYALLNRSQRVAVPMTSNELIDWFMHEGMSDEELEDVSERIIKAVEEVAIIEEEDVASLGT